MGDLDSANTGSMQSSSTGGGGVDDQEYDSSRNNGVSSDSIVSAFLNPISTLNNMSSSSSPHPPPPPPLQLYSFNNTNNNGSSSFDAHNHSHNHLSNFFDLHPPTLPHSSSLPSSSNFMLAHNNHNHAHNNSIINQLDMVWPNKFRPLSSTDDADADAAVTTNNYTINNNHHQQHQQQPPPPPPPPQPQPQPQPVTSSSGRNPKKRTRASRRAPTTVLTTDTNNFRQMVQEFTGVPAPPFTAFSTRARFDLFNGLGLGQLQGQGHSTCAPSSLPTTTTPPYLLRPFPQKIPPLQQPPFLANINNNNPSTTTTNNNTSSSAINLCDQDFINTNPNLTTLLTTTSSVSPLAPANYRGITAPPAAVNVNVNGAADNIIRGTSSSKGEGMVDSWICSSSD